MKSREGWSQIDETSWMWGNYIVENIDGDYVPSSRTTILGRGKYKRLVSAQKAAEDYHNRQIELLEARNDN
jgi:hypothetical protein